MENNDSTVFRNAPPRPVEPPPTAQPRLSTPIPPGIASAALLILGAVGLTLGAVLRGHTPVKFLGHLIRPELIANIGGYSLLGAGVVAIGTTAIAAKRKAAWKRAIKTQHVMWEKTLQNWKWENIDRPKRLSQMQKGSSRARMYCEKQMKGLAERKPVNAADVAEQINKALRLHAKVDIPVIKETREKSSDKALLRLCDETEENVAYLKAQLDPLFAYEQRQKLGNAMWILSKKRIPKVKKQGDRNKMAALELEYKTVHAKWTTEILPKIKKIQAETNDPNVIAACKHVEDQITKLGKALKLGF